MQSVQVKYKNEEFSPWVTKILMASQREGTRKLDNSFIKEWKGYKTAMQVDLSSSSLTFDVNYLADLVRSEQSYSILCVAWSVLSSYICIKDSSKYFGVIPEVCWFMKGVLEMKPSLSFRVVLGHKILKEMSWNFLFCWQFCQGKNAKL